MKKSSRIVSSLLWLFGWFFAVTFASPVAFIVEVEPSSFEVNESVDLTIRAVDANNQTVQDYDEDVRIEISWAGFEDYTVPSDWLYTFVPQDLWIKTFSKGLQINKQWTFTVRVEELFDEDIYGETSVIVGQDVDSVEENVTITSPSDGWIEIAAAITVLASVPLLSNSPYQILLNGDIVWNWTTTNAGAISSVITGAQAWENTLQIQILDSDDIVLWKSSLQTFTYDPLTDETFQWINITPWTSLRQWDRPVFTVDTSDNVTSVTISLSNGQTSPMDKIVAGSFSKTLLLEDDGEIDVSLSVIADGNTTNYTNVMTLDVSENVGIGEVRYFADSVDKSSLQLIWEPIGSVLRFTVEYGTSPTNLNQSRDVASTGITIQNINPDLTYYFQITPVDTPWNAIWTPSDVITVNASILAQAVVCIVEGIELFTEQVWDNYYLKRDLVENVSKYIIYRLDTPTNRISAMEKVWETTETQFQYTFDRYADTETFAYYAVQAECDNGDSLQVWSIEKVEVGPMDTILLVVLTSLLVYLMYMFMYRWRFI